MTCEWARSASNLNSSCGMTGSSRGLICQLGLLVHAADVSTSLSAGRGDRALGGDHQSELVLRHIGGEQVGVFLRLDEDIRAGGSVGQRKWDQLGGSGEVAAGKPVKTIIGGFPHAGHGGTGVDKAADLGIVPHLG